MQKKQFYANGKLLISGEYLVLKGARALAIPLKFGQDLQIETHQSTDKAILHWKAYENNSLWFEILLSIPDLELIKTSDRLIGEKLIQILKTSFKINPNFIEKNLSYKVSSRMTFNKNWGMGSSSTLISNIANWAKIDPYLLLQESFGGSGYDIACASSEKPLFYKLVQDKPKIQTIDFNPSFRENLHFIFLGKKQLSSESISEFNKNEFNNTELIKRISEIGKEMYECKKLSLFQDLMREHEEIISEVLNKKRIKEDRFLDFPGEIKSLGGWGGDFILVATDQNYESVKSYFTEKGLEIIFKYEELVK